MYVYNNSMSTDTVEWHWETFDNIAA